MGDDLTVAYMAGFHKRDDEIASLRGEVERLREELGFMRNLDLNQKYRIGVLIEAIDWACSTGEEYGRDFQNEWDWNYEEMVAELRRRAGRE